MILLDQGLRRFTEAATCIKETVLQRRLVHVGHLLTGNLFSALLGLIAFALTARALGPTDYGVMALIFSSIRVIERVVSFQSWQPLIKYGTGLIGPERLQDFRSLIKFGLFLDIAGAFTGWLVAVALFLSLGALYGWSDYILNAALAYATVLLFRMNGTELAVLRMAGKYRLLAYGQLLGSVVRLALCGIGVVLGGGLVLFCSLWAFSQITASAIGVMFAVRELHRQGVGLGDLMRAPVSGIARRLNGLWSFSWSVNASLTIRSSANELDTVIVGALVDPASAGLYHIAKRIGKVAQQVGDQVQAVLYPDLARLWADNQYVEFRRAVLQIEWLLIAFGSCVYLICFLGAKPLLAWTAGSAYLAAAPLVIAQSIAVMLTLSGAALRSALLAMGKHVDILRLVLVGTLLFHVTAVVLVLVIGAIGANIAHILLGAILLIGFTLIFRRSLRGKNEKEYGMSSNKE